MISASVLTWAIERSGKSYDALEDKFPKIRDWASGEVKPTLRQVEALARATWTPLGFLFLDSPPEMPLPIRHFRTLDDGAPTSTSIELIDTVYAMQTRQSWMRDFLIEEGLESLSFIGTAPNSIDSTNLGMQMRMTLGLSEGWASECPTWTEALRKLRDAMEAVGVIVVINGVVGNSTKRKLSVEEFRGFVLCDEYAPLVFVNGADSKAAQMFTLAHELAHLFFGKSAAFDLRDLQPAEDTTELVCNQAAAEFLVPAEHLRRSWDALNRNPERFQAGARLFKVSQIVIARRALDLALIARDDFFKFYQEYMTQEQRKASNKRAGGDFWANQNLRIGRKFGTAVVSAAREGRLLYSEAYQLTGLFGNAFERFATRLESTTT